MLDSSLHSADRESWHEEPGYSPYIVKPLTDAMKHVKLAGGIYEKYQMALDRVAICLKYPMSLRQTMVVKYVQGSAYLGMADCSHGCNAVDDALDIAEQLDDDASCVELAYLNADACSALLKYRAATEYYDISLSLLRKLGTEDRPIDPDIEQLVLLGFAGSNFILARYAEAAAHIQDSRAVGMWSESAQKPIRAAMILWLEALLHRWVGTPETALNNAVRASEIYSQAGASAKLTSVIRINSLVAEIALDIVDTFAPDSIGDARFAYTTLSDPYIQRAINATRAAQDPLGEGLALLAHLRRECAFSYQPDPTPICEVVLQTAKQYNDVALESQAYTTMARAYSTRGQSNLADACYRNALTVLHGHDLPAMEMWARRALLWDGEL